MSRTRSLAGLLRAHRALDAEEQAHKGRMLALLDGAADPFARASFAPGHFTASGFVLSPDGSALLLVHHRKLDRWLQPGGHVEAGDRDIVAAARRELAEEVGLADLPLEVDGIFDLDVHAIPALAREPAHEHFDVRLLFRAHSLQLRAGNELHAARFVPLEEIEAGAPDRSVLRAARKLRLRAQAARAGRE